MTNELECSNPKSKRDLFRFNGNKPTAINLEHVTMITLEGTKINFTFSVSGISVDLESEEAASSVFEQVLKIWAADVE